MEAIKAKNTKLRETDYAVLANYTNNKAAYLSPPKPQKVGFLCTRYGLFFLLAVMNMNNFYSFKSIHMKIPFFPPTIETNMLYHSFFKISEKKIHISI